MGREVYHGDPNGDLSERKAYDNGVREGAFGLLLNSVRTRNQFVYYELNCMLSYIDSNSGVCVSQLELITVMCFICIGCPWYWLVPC
jgi:hypothetical protein